VTNASQLFRQAGRNRPIYDDEAERLVARAKGGDATATEELVGRYQRLIIVIAKGHETTDNPFDDLVQEGVIALLDCIQRYEPGRSFGRYLQTAVRNRFLKLRRRADVRSCGWVGSIDDEEGVESEGPADPQAEAEITRLSGAGAVERLESSVSPRDAFLLKLSAGLVTGSREDAPAVAAVLGSTVKEAQVVVRGVKRRCRLAYS
jgi:RNA polymerase sigma factor (sigma-70 family)